MSTWWYTGELSSKKEELNPLLPHIAGVMENLGEASFADIRNQLESDFDRRMSETRIVRALENGIKLGVFDVEREFKVCREFTTKEIKRVKRLEDDLMFAKHNRCARDPFRDRNLMSYVKNQRERRKSKFQSKTKKNQLKGNHQLYKYLCQKCRKSVEKETARRQAVRMSTQKERGSRASGKSWESSSSSDNSRVKISEKIEKQPEKSRLLVEKNPMETDPPYYDILM